MNLLVGTTSLNVPRGVLFDFFHDPPRRPDGIRMNTLRPLTEAGWWEWSPLFSGANTNKRGLAVDLSVAEGHEIATRLLATCDVMIENRVPAAVREELSDRGHKLETMADFSGWMGGGQVVLHDSESKVNYAASSPRDRKSVV